MNTKNAVTVLCSLAVWLAGAAAALAQTNSIEALDVSEQAGRIVVRVTTKEPR